MIGLAAAPPRNGPGDRSAPARGTPQALAEVSGERGLGIIVLRSLGGLARSAAEEAADAVVTVLHDIDREAAPAM